MRGSAFVDQRSLTSEETKILIPIPQNFYLGAVYKGRPANGEEGGGFEISDIPGRGRGVVCESSDVRKFLKKWKFQNFSEL